jgi:ferredoxin-NADP reductase
MTAEMERELRVTAMRWEADGVVSLVLTDPESKPLEAWEPGAHVDLCLPNGLVRQYSLCGDPEDLSYYRIAILRDHTSRGGSSFVHESLRPGHLVTVRGPRNNFDFLPAQRYLFIAGGIGITPLLPMVHAADRAGAQWHLVYGGRRRLSMAFLDELANYGDRVEIAPQDETGMLDLARLAAEETTKIYCCGPEPLLKAVETRFSGLRADALQIERFVPKALDVDRDCDRGFSVVCNRSGLRVEVDASTSVLNALQAAGLDLPSSCEEGMCGTCETRIVTGDVEHRDSVLSVAEQQANESLMICVSRSRSDVLVLDL